MFSSEEDKQRTHEANMFKRFQRLIIYGMALEAMTPLLKHQDRELVLKTQENIIRLCKLHDPFYGC